MTTSWTDEEFATIAEALLYPGSRQAVVLTGYSPAVPMAWALDARLQMLDASGKAKALARAQAINTAEAALLGQVLTIDDLRIIRVGEIQFNPSLGTIETTKRIERARQLLASFVDFPVNPNASAASGGGGISGTWST